MPDNLAINYYLCKFILIWFFARFAVTLRLRLGRTSALKNKAKLGCITKKLK